MSQKDGTQPPGFPPHCCPLCLFDCVSTPSEELREAAEEMDRLRGVHQEEIALHAAEAERRLEERQRLLEESQATAEGMRREADRVRCEAEQGAAEAAQAAADREAALRLEMDDLKVRGAVGGTASG